MMEKHKCKLCFRSFANGRALGGHMRSHMLNLYVPPKSQLPTNQFSEEIIINSVSSFSDEEEEDDEIEERELGYELRENPKKSIRLADHEFSGSVVVQDRESETESSKNPIRRRSKRIRKSEMIQTDQFSSDKYKKPKPEKEYSPVSSISDTTPEENVAYCLMMLSRDKWMREKIETERENLVEHDDTDNGDENEDDDDDDDNDELKNRKLVRVRSKYRCETCNRVFRSYQALGGHRASHKKIKNQIGINGNSKIKEQSQTQLEIEEIGNNVGNNSEEKIHECPVCFRVFSSGQALGGHKRSHVTGSSSIAQSRPLSTKFGERLIDLNLPAPVDDDEISQIELSAVSDAEFVNQFRR